MSLIIKEKKVNSTECVTKQEAANIHKTLERILKSINNLNDAVKNLDFSVKSLENKVSDLDAKLNKHCDDLEADILRKVNISKFTPVEEQVESLRSDQMIYTPKFKNRQTNSQG